MEARLDQPALFATFADRAPERDREALLDRLASGVPLIVPTTAAAEILRSAGIARAVAAGLTVWEPRTAFTWSSWTVSLWNTLLVEGIEERTILNGMQERALWAVVIAEQPGRASDGANRHQELAGLAAGAFALAETNRLPEDLRPHSEDTRAFAGWAAEFRLRCRRLSVMPAASLDAALAAHVRAGTMPALPTEVDVAGFTELSASQEDLLEACREVGVIIHNVDVRSDSAERGAEVCSSLPDPGAELRFVAAKVHDLLRTRLADGRSSQVAVILPDPGSERAEIDAVFREVLAPELADLSMPAQAAPWSFATGPSLATQPAARDALDLLRGLFEPLPLERISSLLISPAFASPNTRAVRARLDVQVLRKRARLRPELTLAELHQAVQAPVRFEVPPEALGWLRQLLHLHRERSAEFQRPRTYAEWGEAARALLEAADWRPGDAVRDAWERAVDQLATLDLLNQQVAFSAFVRALERALQTAPLANDTVDAGVTIRVLTLPEAEGACFDAAFVLRSTEGALAVPPRPHPLLPWPLQSRHKLPGANAQADAERTRARLRGLLGAVPHVLFTSALSDTDGPLRPSPLPQELGCSTIAEPDPPEASELLVLDAVADDLVLPMPTPESQHRAGARLLQMQAACPFRAFAELRLHSESLERPRLGLEPRQAGNLIHTTMEEFWKSLETRGRLAGLTESERAEVLEQAAGRAFLRLQQRNPTLSGPDGEGGRWDEAYLGLEHERLLTLGQEWLSLELDRGDFTVQPPENPDPIQVGPMRLTIRPDRVDLTAEGDVVIVDYKTGATGGPKSWEGERPDEPQIPLYALMAEADPDRLAGVTLARIRTGDDEMCWDGLQAGKDVLPGKNPVVNMPERIAEWRQTLDRLAWAFAGGAAAVDPKDANKTCQHCGQRMLCRLNPDALPDEDAEGASDG